jgi:polar amino acid transport system permease protein
LADFFSFLTLPFLLEGIVVTLEVAAGAFLVGLLWGLVLTAVQLGHIPVLSTVARAYAIVTRGTPLLLQLLFVYDILPTVGVRFSAVETAILVLGLSTSTYFSEIIRGSVTALDRGQLLAARSLGMTPWITARVVVAPQALRIALPMMANQCVTLILSSSLASTISVSELTLRSELLVSSNFKVMAVYAASAVMYLVLTGGVAGVQLLLERSWDLERGPRRGSWVRWGEIIGQLTRGVFTPARAPQSPVERASVAGFEDAVDGAPASRASDAEIWKGLGLSGSTRKSALMLSVRGLTKSYGRVLALREVDLDVSSGEVVAILGPSGCGKSTLLRAIARLEPVDAGEVRIAGQAFGVGLDGRQLRGRALARARAEARIGMVFQHFELFSHMSALDNVSVALRYVYGQPRRQAEDWGRGLLEAVGLAPHADRLPRHLSGGQQQRAAIARALAISPRLILLDEPTSALDPEMVHEVLTVLRRLAASGMTMVVVTHELNFAREVADSAVFMQDGTVIESGSPAQLLDHPRSAALRNFLRILEV